MIKKYLKLFFCLILVVNFLLGCSKVKEGFLSTKKNNSDEFLIQKKNPLVLPPNFNTLPEPKTLDKRDNEARIDIEKIIKKEMSFEEDKKKSSVDSSLEKLILQKVKK